MHHKDGATLTVPAQAIDPTRLAEWMDSEGLGSGTITGIRRLGGGTQNVVATFTRRGREFVLRRPPPSGRTDGSKTMLREATILAGLRGTDVPHPELIATCTDESVLGCAFYLMEPVAGFNPASAMPSHFFERPSTMRHLCFAMVDVLAALHRVNVTTAPFSELGTSPGWIERQVPRWARRLAALDQISGYHPLTKSQIEAVLGWLEEHQQPDGHRPGLVHGDFSFANVLIDHDRPCVTAVVDWELASIGDPRLDIAHFLSCLTIKRIPGLWNLEHMRGIPQAEELLEAYASRTGADPASLRWFRVLAGFRLMTLLEETVGRAAGGHAPADLAAAFRKVTEQVLADTESLTLQEN